MTVVNLKVTGKIILLCISLVLITSIILGGFGLYKNRQTLTESTIKKKENQIKLISAYIHSKLDELKNDVQFLSYTPPISGLIRARNGGGYDKAQKSTTKQWKDRLATIFLELMHAKKHYVQVRLIGLEDNGKELVRAERVGTRIRRSLEDELQGKKSESYYKKALSLDRNQIFLSKFSANKEFGKITLPIQMVLRAATPIYETRKKPFGFIIININYNQIFSSLKYLTSGDSDYFVADSDGNILLHSNPKFNIGRDLSTIKKINDYMPELSAIFEEDKNIITKEIHKNTDKVVVSKKLRYDPVNPSKYLSIFLITDKSKIIKKVNEGTRQDLLIISLLIIFSVILSSYFSKFITGPIKKLTTFAENIGKGDGTVNIDPGIKSQDEIGALAQKLTQMSSEIDRKNLALLNQKDALDHSAIVAETDSKGRITYVNDKLLEVSKYSREELLGQDHRILNSGHHPKEFFVDLWKTISKGEPWQNEVCNRAKDDSIYWVDTTIFPVRDGKKISKYVAIRFDITDRKIAEDKLIEAKESAQRATRSKSEFLANMSHEIRTPMNGIIGFTTLLLDQNLTKEQEDNVNIIRNCGEHLLVLINDFLDFAKIESGKLQIENHPFDIEQAFDSLTYIVDHLASQKGVNVDISVSPNIPRNIVSDPTRLRQILINLVSNAVKFTSEGNVWIKVDAVPKEGKTYEYHFSVKDTGIGISQENITKLFTVFAQADASTTRKYGGTGLGLSICKKLVELMGGKIWVESEVGVGSTFHFTIVAETVEAKDVKQYKDKKENVDTNLGNNKPLKILIAEDNKINQKLSLGLLSKLNYQADVVENGKIALDVTLKSNYDVILMDVQMPEMDGLESTRQICRKMPGDKRPVIIGLTANAMSGDREKCLLAGMSDYVPKPIRLKSLADALEKAYDTLVESNRVPGESKPDDNAKQAS